MSPRKSTYLVSFKRSLGPSGPSILDIDPEPIPSLGPSLKFDPNPFKKGRSRADPGPILGSDQSLLMSLGRVLVEFWSSSGRVQVEFGLRSGRVEFWLRSGQVWFRTFLRGLGYLDVIYSTAYYVGTKLLFTHLRYLHGQTSIRIFY